MISRVDIHQPDIAWQIYTLQQAAYHIESQIIGYPTLPPLMESLEDLQQSGEQFLAFQAAGQLAGVLSYTHSPNALEICRMMVSPAYFRRGIAGKLLQAVETIEPNINQIVVSTAAQNQPALSLYQKYGYRQTFTTTLPDGLKLVTLHKQLPYH
ncbi:MAG: GNAT family N-acetyltransferase [Anaerolineae bacterium]